MTEQANRCAACHKQIPEQDLLSVEGKSYCSEVCAGMKKSGGLSTGREFPYQAANYSLYSIVVAVFLGLLVQTTNPTVRIVLGSLNCLLILSSFIAAVYALISIRKYGRESLLIKGIVGLLISGFILFSIVMVTLNPRYNPLLRTYSPEKLAEFQPVIPDSQVIINPDLGIRFEVPPGFEEEATPADQFLHVFGRGQTITDKISLSIIKMNFLQPNRAFDQAEKEMIENSLPPSSQTTYFQEEWEGHQINGYVMKAPQGYFMIVETSVIVPLSTGALRLIVTSDEQNQEEARGILMDVLNSLRGKSNWDW